MNIIEIIKNEKPQYRVCSEDINKALKEPLIKIRNYSMLESQAYRSKKELQELYNLVGKNAFKGHMLNCRFYTDFEGLKFIKEIFT